jgi:CubicO group peptidase (beta-lactamase class C family)
MDDLRWGDIGCWDSVDRDVFYMAMRNRLDSVIDTALEGKRIVGTVALVAQGGSVVYRRAAGFADREAGRPMVESQVFRLASLTKPIVTAAAMALIEQGKLTLADPVTKWLPEFRPALADGRVPLITIRHLLTHTAGLGYGFAQNGDGPYHRAGVCDGLDQPGLPMEENLRRLASVPLLREPGTAWQYSLSLDVLGGVLERVGDAPLQIVVKRLVTGPLGMLDTDFFAREPARLAVPYVDGTPEPLRMRDSHAVTGPAGGSVHFSLARALDPLSYPSGGAGMVGTADEFLTFLETLRTGGAPILSSATVQTMMMNQIGPHLTLLGEGWGFGFGFAVLTNPQAAGTRQSVGTVRWGGAYGHSWFVDPQRELSVAILTDTAFEGMNGAFTEQMRDAVLG